jgi:hypothetical protein
MNCYECDTYDAEESYDGLCVYCYAESMGSPVVTCMNCGDKSLNEEYYFEFEGLLYCRGCHEIIMERLEEQSDTDLEDDEDEDEDEDDKPKFNFDNIDALINKGNISAPSA